MGMITRNIKRLLNGDMNFRTLKTILYNRNKVKSINRDLNEKMFVIAGTPDTANLGDHLITEGEVLFLETYFQNINRLEITGDYIRYADNQVKEKVSPNDIIIITGGGFLGSLWMSEEEMVRRTINMFPQNNIVIFPQTIYFEDNEFGKKQFSETYDVYSGHKKLYICLREEKSYKYMLENMKGAYKKCMLIPDIATFYSDKSHDIDRKSILWCMRQDKEMILSQDTKDSIRKYLKNKSEEVIDTDTVINKDVKSIKRHKELNEKLLQFKGAKLVITDRLHGMIMAAVTGTPCIAFNNKTDKVRGVYKWIESLEYIECLENLDDVKNSIDKFLNNDTKTYKYNNEYLIKYFDELAETLENIIHEEIG